MAYTELEKKYARKERAFILKMKEYREVALEYLKDLLTKYQCILFNFNGDDPDEYVCVSYDGGNHPEYASDMFSVVSSISLTVAGEIALETEDDSEYTVDRVETHELRTIIETINSTVLPTFRGREKRVAKVLKKKEFVNGMDVSSDTDKADTIKYDNEAKAIRYYAGGKEVSLPLSDKQEILSFVCQEIDY